MFDFGAAHRTEGDRPGINDKGLVTFDRKVKKDSYYFYKANWNKQEPMIYLAEKRCRLRYQPEQTFMAFTTAPEAELFVNGVSCGKQKQTLTQQLYGKGQTEGRRKYHSCNYSGEKATYGRSGSGI